MRATCKVIFRFFDCAGVRAANLCNIQGAGGGQDVGQVQMAKPGFKVKADHTQSPGFLLLNLRVHRVILCATPVKFLLIIVIYLFYFLLEKYSFPIYSSD